MKVWCIKYTLGRVNRFKSCWWNGIKYLFGTDVNQDYKSSLNKFEKASNYGIIDANNALGEFYFFGIGIKQNYSRDIHRNGYGVNCDILKAKYYYELSSNQGNETAKKNLDELNLLDKLK